MAAETHQDRAEWQASPEESGVISPEHLALVDFACRLGSFTTNDEPGIADATNVRQDANLLMSLLAAPHVVSDDPEHSTLSPVSTAPGVLSHSNDHDHHYLSDTASTSSTTTASSSHRRDSFRFSHPSLSLDGKWKFPYERPLKTPCTAPEDKAEDESSPAPPAVLLGRALKVDDREAHRLSADAMARNLLQSFQKAIKWRIQAWMDALSASLVAKEAALLCRKLTKEAVKELLVKSNEAQLYLRLRQAVQSIEVQHAETCFHVLPQRSQSGSAEEGLLEDDSSGNPVGKRRRIESEDSTDELRMTGETAEYQYSVCHALEFDGTIHLLTPAGHSEITLEVPGYIEGTFLSSEQGMEDLTAVEVEIDTNILASMVEKSCRIIVRSSVEHICKEQAADAEADAVDALNLQPRQKQQQDTEEPIKTTEAASPYPGRQAATPTAGITASAAIVTPRSKVAPFLPNGPGFLQIPEDLDSANRAPRRISPQPHSPAMGDSMSTYTPSTPSKRPRDTLPPMVSPAPKEAFQLSKREEEAPQEEGQNLPVLVEVACAAIQAKSGLKMQ